MDCSGLVKAFGARPALSELCIGSNPFPPDSTIIIAKINGTSSGIPFILAYFSTILFSAKTSSERFELVLISDCC